MKTDFSSVFKQYGHEELAGYLSEERQLPLDEIETIEINGFISLFFLPSDVPAVYVIGQSQDDLAIVSTECIGERLTRCATSPAVQGGEG